MILHQRDAKWWFKLNGAMRLAIVRGLFGPIARPLVLTEYPKSGGTWLSQMLSATLDIPYPRNRLPQLRRCIIHGCYLKVHKDHDTIVVWRDGRDIMVSFYYHLVFEKPITSARYSRQLISELEINEPYDIEGNLPRFIRWAFEGGYPGYSWNDFVSTWFDRTNIITTKYENMIEKPEEELIRILKILDNSVTANCDISKIVKHYSFLNQSNREPGTEDVKSFVRKGIVGDWKNVFSQQAREIFHQYGGDTLLKLDYETDDSWVNGKCAHPNKTTSS